jgi:peptidoglycan/LPS O-acetylase OafA/YrhL
MKGIKSQRIEVLDGIRGIAILMILAFHYINNPLTSSQNSNPLLKLLEKSTEWGWAGVDLFFVLSGFLIGSILLANRSEGNYFKAFYTRRVLRILPAYVLLLVTFYSLKYFFDTPNSYIFEKPLPTWTYLTFTQNIFMGLNGSFGSQGLGPTWSLAIEEQFYILAPLLIYLIKPKRTIFWLLIVIVAAPFFRFYSTNWYMSYTWFTSRMDSLAIGMALAWYLYAIGQKWFKALSNKALLVLMGALFVLMMGLEFALGSMGVLKHTFIALFFAICVLLSLSAKGYIKDFLSSKILIWFGMISYPLYLFHNLFNGLFHQLFANNLKPKLENEKEVVLTLIALVVSLLFSHIVHKYLEQPFIAKGKQFKYKLND